MQDGPLDMRMDSDSGQTAAEWLATANEQEIAQVVWEYGEERHSRRIARAIVETRVEQPLQTTQQLAKLIASNVPKKEKHKHPATRTFQAIRIFINQELDDLRQVLQQAVDVLKVGGRLAVISFHSLEDRIVKRFLREQSQGERLPLDLPVQNEQTNAAVKLIGKAIRPSADEIAMNPRARSAILRVAEKLSV